MLGNNAGSLNAAIYGNANSTGGWAGYFDGDVNINGVGTITSGSWNTSDKRFKKDIIRLGSVAEKIQKLNGYSYKFRTDEFKEKNFDDRSHIGFIAQELKEVFPELVKEDAKGYYAVDYQGMIPVLLEAVKELQNQVTVLSQQKQAAPTGIEDLNAANDFYMENIPNPYATETTINYTLPQSVNTAYLAVYDLSGKQLATYAVNKSNSSLTISANALAAGIYLYSIIADNKVMGTKRMVVAGE